MRPMVRDGWLLVPYDGHDLATVHLAAAQSPTAEHWAPAFLDYHDGQRIAKIRTPAPTGRPVTVWLRVGDTVTSAGTVVL
ncbi:hypothetical protein AB0C10_21305 [Microbispora amethystogenes]|uniref:hypothetical protein n=1 Tax=Microbispora amethystogenes TaxID=1427754 RepID=UPI0033C3F798